MKKIIIIGGGAAGFFSAIRIAEKHPDYNVIILERGKEVLQKVKISGGGRCNVTHACWTPKELVKFYPRGSKALLGPFHKFACGDTVDWFEKRGVPLKIEEDGRIFPKSNNSQSVMDCLIVSAQKAGVKILLNQRVEEIRLLDNKQFEIRAKDIFFADSLVLTGGSSTALWAVLENLGHSIETAVPSLFTFNIKDKRIAELTGLSVNNAFISVEGQKELSANGPLLITHWGLSGPGVLKLSSWGARWMHDKSYNFNIKINWIHSEGNEAQVREKLLKFKTEMARKMVISNPLFSIPTRLWQNLCLAAAIEKETNWANLNKQQLNKLLEELCSSSYHVNGKSTNKEEFVTAGGIKTDEINFTRFESKIIPNLYFAGEILDIDALTGGFNFQAAWTGGWIIGESI